MEASGLDFGGLGVPFWRVRASFSKPLDVIFGTTNAKNAQKTAKTKAPSQGGQTAKGWVGGGDPPGGFQSAAHRRCAGRAGLKSHRPQPKLQTYHKAPNSSSLSGSWTPLFFSPQEPGDHRRPCAKKRKSVALWLFFSIFCPSKLQSKFCIEQTSKKMRKSRLWLPKTLPKLSQNRAFFENVDF